MKKLSTEKMQKIEGGVMETMCDRFYDLWLNTTNGLTEEFAMHYLMTNC